MSDATAPRIDRRDCLRLGVGLTAAAALSTPVTAQEDPYDGWFDDVDNYEGTSDFRGEETVTVTVGAGDDGLLYDPPAIAIDEGTTVVWEWTGEGGGHNVVESDGEFESEIVDDDGHTFEHTFEGAGIFTYVCTPHEALGMKGAVAVGDAIDEEALIDADTDEDTAEDGDGDEEAEPAAGFLDDFPIPPAYLIGGAGIVALLSPALFAVLLKFVYNPGDVDGDSDGKVYGQ